MTGKQTQKAPPSGLLLLRKEAGVTSFEALGPVKRALATGKVGHTGTLDKFACGLLLVLTGRALKLGGWFSHCDKQYEGTVRFGIETNTLDPEGSPVAEAGPPSREAVEKALPQFTGEILQAPPAYSAIHIDGKRASALARRGEMPEMKKRPVTVYELRLLSWEPPFARIFVHCSSGTYIRSLARDLALAAGSRGHLSALVRTRVAGFRLEDAATVPDQLRPIDRTVIEALGIPCYEINASDIPQILHGKPLAPILPLCESMGENPPETAALCSGNNLIAIIEKNGDKWKYGYVYGISA